MSDTPITPRSPFPTLLSSLGEALGDVSAGLRRRRESLFVTESMMARRQLLSPDPVPGSDPIDETPDVDPLEQVNEEEDPYYDDDDDAEYRRDDRPDPPSPTPPSPRPRPVPEPSPRPAPGPVPVPSPLARTARTIILGGRVVPLSATPDAHSDLKIGRLYDCEKRYLLNAEQLTEFRNSSTRFVLRKRLNMVSISDTDDNVLENVSNLELQVTSIREHLRVYDLDNVFNILKPVDTLRSQDLRPGSWNLFEDYVSLDPMVVANHSVYCAKWLGEAPYIRENLSLTYTFLKSNTDDTLWAKCLSACEAYPADAQGGPLMFSLLMRRIQNTTETALTHLVEKIKNIKLSSIDGENVETVVLLVKAALKLVDRASKQDVVRLPLDFPKTLLDVYQTSSVPEFNALFSRLVIEAQTAQYVHGGNAQWPAIEHINALAHNSYLSMVATGTWHVPASAAAKAYTAGRRRNRGKGAQALLAGPPKPPVCWNCEGPHHSKECPKPMNQALFDANKAKWQAARDAARSGKPAGGNRRHNRRAPPTHKFVDGKPMVLNKKGVYVLDQAKLQHDKKKAAIIDSLATSLVSLDGGGVAPASTPAATPPPANPVSDRVTRTRALLLEHLSKF